MRASLGQGKGGVREDRRAWGEEHRGREECPRWWLHFQSRPNKYNQLQKHRDGGVCWEEGGGGGSVGGEDGLAIMVHKLLGCFQEEGRYAILYYAIKTITGNIQHI